MTTSTKPLVAPVYRIHVESPTVAHVMEVHYAGREAHRIARIEGPEAIAVAEAAKAEMSRRAESEARG
jgi:hypothetical protein